jgi:hypothetical protein
MMKTGGGSRIAVHDTFPSLTLVGFPVFREPADANVLLAPYNSGLRLLDLPCSPVSFQGPNMSFLITKSPDVDFAHVVLQFFKASFYPDAEFGPNGSARLEV